MSSIRPEQRRAVQRLGEAAARHTEALGAYHADPRTAAPGRPDPRGSYWSFVMEVSMSDTDVNEATAEIPQRPAAEVTQPPPTPTQALQVVLHRCAAFDPKLAATGLAALRALEDLPNETPRGFGKWRHGEVIKRYVKRLVPRFRDPEAITELGDQLLRLASRLLRPREVTPEQVASLRKMAIDAKASEISRTLLAWRYDIFDLAVRHMQERQIAVSRWG